MLEQPTAYDVDRINRYIMECKLREKEIYYNSREELIDTLWNVNAGRVRDSLMREIRINRYIMECK